MGLSRLLGLCFAVFSLSSVNFAHANYIYDAPTRTWMPTRSTVLAPPNSSGVFVPAPGTSSTPTVNNGGFTTPSSGSFRSPAVNGSSYRVPVPLEGTVTKPNVNKALASRLLRGGLAGVALGYGIDALLDQIDGLIEDGGVVKKSPKQLNEVPEGAIQSNSTAVYPHQTPSCTGGCIKVGTTPLGPSNPNILLDVYCAAHVPNKPWERFIGYKAQPSRRCYYMSGANPNDGYTTAPYPPTELDDAIESHYNPDPTDYPTLVSEPEMQPTVVSVGPIPPVEFPPVTTTSTDSGTGQTTVTVTNTRLDFGIVDNDSSQPKIVSEETTTTETYIDGVKTSESTTTSSSGAQTGSDPATTEIDIPTDCNFMPTVCAFIDWFKDLTTDEEPDLSVLLTDEDYERDYTIDFGTASCPEPIDINISFIDQTVQISYEPACDFVGYARPFILISAYIFAIYIGLGVVRNG